MSIVSIDTHARMNIWVAGKASNETFDVHRRKYRWFKEVLQITS
jgi:hypothetical protein